MDTKYGALAGEVEILERRNFIFLLIYLIWESRHIAQLRNENGSTIKAISWVGYNLSRFLLF